MFKTAGFRPFTPPSLIGPLGLSAPSVHTEFRPQPSSGPSGPVWARCAARPLWACLAPKSGPDAGAKEGEATAKEAGSEAIRG